MKPLCILVLLAFVSLLGCGGGGPAPDAGVQDAVVGVSVTGTDRLASRASTVLTAVVEGTGTFSSEVTWSLLSGGGSLSATTGASVTYTAPFARAETAVTVQATSEGDPSKHGVFTFTVARAPAASLLDGAYSGFRSVEGTFIPTEPPPRVEQFTLEPVSDTQVRLKPITGFPQGVLVDVHEDGTLTIPPQEGPASRYDKYCFRQQYFMREESSGPAGTGTWDAQGNLSLTWVSRYERECIGPGGPFPGTHSTSMEKTTSVFTGRRDEASWPPAPSLLVGVYEGTSSFSETTSPDNGPETTQSGTMAFTLSIEQAEDGRFLLKMIDDHPEGIPGTVQNDGRDLVFSAFSKPPTESGEGCQRQLFIGWYPPPEGAGWGSWGNRGELSLLWGSRSVTVCTGPDGATHRTVSRTLNTFTGRKR